MNPEAPRLLARTFIRTAYLLALCLTFVAPGAMAQDFRDYQGLHITHVQGRVWMISGAGGNVTLQIGDLASVVVDTGTAAMGEKVLGAIKSLTNTPIEFIINTSIDEDHSGGNGSVAKAASKELGGAAADNRAAGGRDAGGTIVAYVTVLDRMTESEKTSKAIPKADWPTDPFDTSNWKVYNDEPIILTHAPKAHSDGDTYVFFRRSDVVSVGELFVPSRFPVINEEQGGTIDGIIDSLTTIIDDILVPRENEEGGTYVIPGRGRVCDRTDIVNYRDALAIIRGRIADLVKKGKTLQEVKAAKPTLGYNGLYGAETGAWTTDMFVSAIYRNLTKDKGHK